ncbi:hypothetical protein Q5752_000675 [Cryptotrichosporon argae]
MYSPLSPPNRQQPNKEHVGTERRLLRELRELVSQRLAELSGKSASQHFVVPVPTDVVTPEMQYGQYMPLGRAFLDGRLTVQTSNETDPAQVVNLPGKSTTRAIFMPDMYGKDTDGELIFDPPFDASGVLPSDKIAQVSDRLGSEFRPDSLKVTHVQLQSGLGLRLWSLVYKPNNGAANEAEAFEAYSTTAGGVFTPGTSVTGAGWPPSEAGSSGTETVG